MASVTVAGSGSSQDTISSSHTTKDANHLIEIDLPADVGDQILRNAQSRSQNKLGLSLMLGKQPVSIFRSDILLNVAHASS